MRIGPRSRSAEWGTDATLGRSAGKPQGIWVLVALAVMALLLVAGFFYLVPKLPGMVIQAGSTITSMLGSSQVNSTYGLVTYSPLIENGSATVSYPPDYGELANYTLNLINSDRSNFSLGALTLSPNDAGQQHAESMLQYGYFSHYDTQGYKPYMRYTLLGGVGAVFENVALAKYSGLYFTTPSNVEDALKALEWSMVYNDSICCSNGHRDNILNPLHDRVSIGLAYNGTSLFFVEDFENYYVNMSVTTSKFYAVTMKGTVLSPGVSPTEAFVAYDDPPTAETAAQLNSAPHEYDPGNITGGVLSPCSFACPRFSQGITVYASVWEFTPTDMKVSFSFSEFVQRYGAGVYTIYLVTGSNTDSAITSISIFVS